MRRGGLYILSLYVCCITSFAEPVRDITAILNTSWAHYKKYKIEEYTGRPLADIDTQDVGLGSSGNYLTFSETVSYVLYRAALINDQETFDRVWYWAQSNLQRKNIPQVYEWYSKSWIPLPPWKNDNLFAWRFTPNIAGRHKDGIIYYYWTPSENGKLWRDGLDVAPDADQLIAGALILAHLRWGDRPGSLPYLQYARLIMYDLWDKTVRILTPGVLLCSLDTINDWFTYQSPQGRISLSGDHTNFSISVGATTYAGIGHILNNCDLSHIEAIRITVRGNGLLRIILEDKDKKTWRSESIALHETERYSEYSIQLPQVKDSTCNLQSICAVMLDFSNGSYDICRLSFGRQPQFASTRYHLFSNDKNMPWINVSYYMPFLYRIFAKIDTVHPWNQLAADAYSDMHDALFCAIANGQKQLFTGTGILLPNWFCYNELGKIVDLPWAVDGVIDDFMSGWDAFRAWYYMALDKEIHAAAEPNSFFTGRSYDFFKQQLTQWGYIRTGFTIAGDILNMNWVDQNGCGANGAYLAFFKAAGDTRGTKKILAAILKQYNAAGYWEKKTEYYKQNWVWLGLAFYNDLGKDVFTKAYQPGTL